MRTCLRKALCCASSERHGCAVPLTLNPRQHPQPRPTNHHPTQPTLASTCAASMAFDTAASRAAFSACRRTAGLRSACTQCSLCRRSVVLPFVLFLRCHPVLRFHALPLTDIVPASWVSRVHLLELRFALLWAAKSGNYFKTTKAKS